MPPIHAKKFQTECIYLRDRSPHPRRYARLTSGAAATNPALCLTTRRKVGLAPGPTGPGALAPGFAEVGGRGLTEGPSHGPPVLLQGSWAGHRVPRLRTSPARRSRTVPTPRARHGGRRPNRRRHARDTRKRADAFRKTSIPSDPMGSAAGEKARPWNVRPSKVATARGLFKQNCLELWDRKILKGGTQGRGSIGRGPG